MSEKIELGDDQKIRISALWDTLKRYDTYIGTVNFKSGLLASFNTAVFGGLLLKADQILSTNPKIHCLSLLLLLIISGLSLLSIFYVLKSIWPNLSSASTNNKSSEPSIFFFGSVANNFSAQNYASKLRDTSIDALETDLAIQVHEVATITLTKFKTIAKASKVTTYNLISLFILALVLTLTPGISP